MPGLRSADPPSPEAIRAWRIRKSYGVAELAEMSGLSYQHMVRLETVGQNNRRPSAQAARALATALGLTIEELRAGPPERMGSADKREPALIG